MAEDLLAKIRTSSARVIDVFQRLDEDMSGFVDKKEFRKGISVFFSLSKDAKVPRSDVDDLFALLDRDNSGTLELKELDKMLRVGATTEIDKSLRAGAAGEIELKAENKISIREREGKEAFEYSSLAGGTATAHARSLRGGDYTIIKEGTNTIQNAHTLEVTLDTTSNESPAEQLRHALTKNAVRVVDLFRDWDVNGDGQVSRKEFITGVKLLGFPGGSAAASLFDSWDDDGSGTLEVRLLLLLPSSNRVGLPRCCAKPPLCARTPRHCTAPPRRWPSPSARVDAVTAFTW